MKLKIKLGRKADSPGPLLALKKKTSDTELLPPLNPVIAAERNAAGIASSFAGGIEAAKGIRLSRFSPRGILTERKGTCLHSVSRASSPAEARMLRSNAGQCFRGWPSVHKAGRQSTQIG